MTDKQKSLQFIPPHGAYRELQSYKMSEIVYDATVVFLRSVHFKAITHP